MNAALIQVALNGAFSLIALLRQQGMTNTELNMRLDRVDNKQEPITIAEVQASLDSWQTALDAARRVP